MGEAKRIKRALEAEMPFFLMQEKLVAKLQVEIRKYASDKEVLLGLLERLNFLNELTQERLERARGDVLFSKKYYELTGPFVPGLTSWESPKSPHATPPPELLAMELLSPANSD